MTSNGVFASAPAQLAVCLGHLVQWDEGREDAGFPLVFSAELIARLASFRSQRWRFWELFPFAVQLGHAGAEQADEFLNDLGELLAEGGQLDGRLFAAFLQWAPDLERQIARLHDEQFRGEYMHVLRKAWGELKDPWNNEGLPSVQRMASLWSRHLAPGGIGPLFSENLLASSPVFAGAIERAAERGTLRVIPLWAVGGGFYVPAWDEVYIGFAPDGVEFVAQMEQRAEQLSGQFAALSNKTRVQLLCLLDEHFPETVGDLALNLDLPHSNVSTHLKVLQQAGLVRMKKSGVRTLVTRNREALEALKHALEFDL